MGITGILQRNEQLPEQKKYHDAIAQSSANLLVILNDILGMNKLEAVRLELEQVPFDPRAVIGNVRGINMRGTTSTLAQNVAHGEHRRTSAADREACPASTGVHSSSIRSVFGQ